MNDLESVAKRAEKIQDLAKRVEEPDTGNSLVEVFITLISNFLSCT